MHILSENLVAGRGLAFGGQKLSLTIGSARFSVVPTQRTGRGRLGFSVTHFDRCCLLGGI